MSNYVCKQIGYHDWRTTKRKYLERCDSCGALREFGVRTEEVEVDDPEYEQLRRESRIKVS